MPWGSGERCYQPEVGSGEEEYVVDHSTIMIGIMMGILGSIGINIGNNMQALGLSIQQRDQRTKKPPVWYIGTAIFLSASIINCSQLPLPNLLPVARRVRLHRKVAPAFAVVAFGFAPAAILAPLESIQFVANVVFGRVVNKANITFRMYAGSFLIVAGTTVSIAFGPKSVYKFGLHHLKCFWVAPGWIFYLLCVIAIGVTMECVHRKYQRAKLAGAALAHSDTIMPVAFAMSSATVGTQSVVQAKILSELMELLLGLHETYVATDYFLYVTLLLFLSTVVVWLYRLNQALSLYDPLFIIPLLQVSACHRPPVSRLRTPRALTPLVHRAHRARSRTTSCSQSFRVEYISRSLSICSRAPAK